VTRPEAEAGFGTWTVEVPLPIGADWLSLNKMPRHKGDHIRRNALIKNLRRIAFDQIRAARVPQKLGRIRVQVELRFVDRRVRDASNFEPTIKPIIDAVQPTRQYDRTVRKRIGNRLEKVTEKVTEWGAGLVDGDDRRYLERPEPTIGEPIGAGTGRKGTVVLHITALQPVDTLEDE
jgi:hypothetical protein